MDGGVLADMAREQRSGEFELLLALNGYKGNGYCTI